MRRRLIAQVVECPEERGRESGTRDDRSDDVQREHRREDACERDDRASRERRIAVGQFGIGVPGCDRQRGHRAGGEEHEQDGARGSVVGDPEHARHHGRTQREVEASHRPGRHECGDRREEQLAQGRRHRRLRCEGSPHVAAGFETDAFRRLRNDQQRDQQDREYCQRHLVDEDSWRGCVLDQHAGDDDSGRQSDGRPRAGDRRAEAL